MLRRLGADVVEVRKPEQLDGLDGLVIPGGESTDVHAPDATSTASTRRCARFAGPVFGTCAGMIVLDRDHLGLVDIARAPQRVRPPGRVVRDRPRACRAASEPLRAVFIRAPWIEEVGPGRRGARRGRRPSGARARGALPRRRVPPGADRRHAAPRAVSRSRKGGCVLSGHSKWSSIKHKKGAADAKRGKLFSKLDARDHRRGEGGRRRSRPTTLALANAIEKAKSYSMPKDNIERAIAKGSGEGADAATRSRRSSTRATAPRASR